MYKKFAVETNEHGATNLQFINKFRMPNAIQCFEFKTDRDFDVNEQDCDYFRLEIHETAGYATIVSAHEYGQGYDDYLVMDNADHIFDVAQINALAQIHKSDIRDDQDLYDAWAAKYDNDENETEYGKNQFHEGQRYQELLAERDNRLAESKASVFDHCASYAEIELWQAVLANANEMTHVVPGTDIETCLRRIAEERIDVLKGQIPKLEDFKQFKPAAERRAQYVGNLAIFCGVRDAYPNDAGEVVIPRELVGTVLRTLNSYGAEHGQMMCDGWEVDNDYQEVTWEMYVDWMENEEGDEDCPIPEEHERFILV